MQAKLSKRELDHFAVSLLGEDNGNHHPSSITHHPSSPFTHPPFLINCFYSVYLHNIFVQAILSNARCSQPPEVPLSNPIIKRKPPNSKPSISNSSNHPSINPIPTSSSAPPSLASSSGGVTTKIRPKGTTIGGKNAKSMYFINHFTPSLYISGFIFIIKLYLILYTPSYSKRCSYVPFAVKERKPPQPQAKKQPLALGPEYTVLKARLQKIATEAGLTGIPAETTSLYKTSIQRK